MKDDKEVKSVNLKEEKEKDAMEGSTLKDKIAIFSFVILQGAVFLAMVVCALIIVFHILF